MEVTLRKAAALSKALLDAARKPTLSKTIEVSIYTEDAISTLAEVGVATFQANLAKALDLTALAFDIRRQIATANHAAGIDTLLNEKARLDAQERFLVAVETGAAGTPLDIAETKLSVMRARSESGVAHYASEELSVQVVTDDDLANEKTLLQLLRRRKVAIADELLVANTTARVRLSDSAVASLRAAELI